MSVSGLQMQLFPVYWRQGISDSLLFFSLVTQKIYLHEWMERWEREKQFNGPTAINLAGIIAFWEIIGWYFVIKESLNAENVHFRIEHKSE